MGFDSISIQLHEVQFPFYTIRPFNSMELQTQQSIPPPYLFSKPNLTVIMPQQKQAEPETYSSVLKNIRDLSGKKKASALLPVMRTMTKYLHKGDSELIDATLYHILVLAASLQGCFLHRTPSFDAHRQGRQQGHQPDPPLLLPTRCDLLRGGERCMQCISYHNPIRNMRSS